METNYTLTNKELIKHIPDSPSSYREVYKVDNKYILLTSSFWLSNQKEITETQYRKLCREY